MLVIVVSFTLWSLVPYTRNTVANVPYGGQSVSGKFCTLSQYYLLMLGRPKGGPFIEHKNVKRYAHGNSGIYVGIIQLGMAGNLSPCIMIIAECVAEKIDKGEKRGTCILIEPPRPCTGCIIDTPPPLACEINGAGWTCEKTLEVQGFGYMKIYEGTSK